ncbi:MAG: sugar O-acetyltransferase, partial [Parabacteroides sp.]|nr:sugar O-acetyltransferase [Parabacteroides sp.]
GGGVIVCPGVTIGDRCIIAAGSVVTHDIPSDSMAAGIPAKVKKSLNTTGLPEGN